MSTGRIGPQILAGLNLDPLLVLAVPHPTDPSRQINFALDEVIVPNHQQVIEYWRDRALVEAGHRQFAESALKGVQDLNDIQKADVGCAAGGVPGQRSVTDPDYPHGIAQEQAADPSAAQPGFEADFNAPFNAPFNAQQVAEAMNGMVIIRGAQFDKVGDIISKLTQSVSNGLEVRIGDVGFGQKAVVFDGQLRPFSQLPFGRYVYYPEG